MPEAWVTWVAAVNDAIDLLLSEGYVSTHTRARVVEQIAALALRSPDHMSHRVDLAIEKARAIKMTEAEKEAQKRSFAFGNLRIDRESVTRDLVDEVADEQLKMSDVRSRRSIKESE